MRLEHIPILVGGLFGLIGLALVIDALLADGTFVATERRRRPRAERNPRGELLVGLGVLLLAASLVSPDGWRYGTMAVIAGAVLLALGALLNISFLRELFSFRGPLRRSEHGAPPSQDRGNRRIR